MAQVSMTVRMDSQLKQMFDALCREFDMSVNTAINVYAKAVVQTKNIPFRMGVDTSESADETVRSFRQYRAQVAADDRPELTLDEINEEIRLAREERDAKTARENAYLVTGNLKHFPKTPIVVTPAEMLEILNA